MQAKVIATGEIVNIEKHSYNYALNVQTFKDVNNGKIYGQLDLEFIDAIHTPKSNIDWEQRRFELVKAVMNGLIANTNYMSGLVKEAIKNEQSDEEIEKYVREDLSSTAIDITDTLIKKLKEK